MKDATSEVLDNEVKITMELPLENGSSYTWVLASPQALILKFIAASLALQSVLRPLLVDNSCSKPLSLVHYHDEITAGALLAPIKSRSFTAFRFTFKEFGKYMSIWPVVLVNRSWGNAWVDLKQRVSPMRPSGMK